MHVPRAITFAFFLLLTAISCNNQPAHLSPEQMKDVLLDMHLAESYSTIAGPDSVRKLGKNEDSLTKFYTVILHHHGVTTAQFIQSMDWYRDRPEQLDSIYSKMISVLNKMQNPESKLSPHP